ncbi:MAG: YggS family pyridoxal phosphate-dependent enzyme [Oscillatoriales cyanobacterium C42_A2020_001]|nr:YggS family pyridoxal phosphate-dependent enzyme [Leptolyngbyaceae cyanobacterium C42_A2020_001]
MVGSIAERIAQIRETLPDSVRLIAVTKQVPVEAMRAAYAAGIRDFGESRIQEAETKQAQLQDLPDVVWHMIGHLQANKAQKALQLFRWIHSVDDLKLAQRLDRLAATSIQKPNVCLQVKILPDPNKHGWTVSELWKDLPDLNNCNHLNICGLMTIPPVGLEPTELLKVFQETQNLAIKVQTHPELKLPIQELSMGMSNDYSIAIAAGSTMIRLGRILFGDRPT